MIRYALSTKGSGGSASKCSTVERTPSMLVAPLKMSFPRRNSRLPPLNEYASRKQPSVERTERHAGCPSQSVE